MKGELLLDQRKPQYTHENLMTDLRLSDPYDYKISLRMAGRPEATQGSWPNSRWKKYIREAVSHSQRLLVTLRYLGTGIAFWKLFLFDMLTGQQTVAEWMDGYIAALTADWSLSSRLYINPLNPELNPICYLLALLGAHHFLHVSRMRVKSLTFRLLMSYIYIYIYIYGAPILDVSRSHTTTHHSL